MNATVRAARRNAVKRLWRTWSNSSGEPLKQPVRKTWPCVCSWVFWGLTGLSAAPGSKLLSPTTRALQAKKCQSSSGAKINPLCLCSPCQIQLNNELQSFSTSLSHLLLIWCNRCTIDKVGANSASLWASGAENLKQHNESSFSFVQTQTHLRKLGINLPLLALLCILPLLLGKTYACFNCPSLIYCDLDPLSKPQSVSYGKNY